MSEEKEKTQVQYTESPEARQYYAEAAATAREQRAIARALWKRYKAGGEGWTELERELVRAARAGMPLGPTLDAISAQMRLAYSQARDIWQRDLGRLGFATATTPFLAQARQEAFGLASQEAAARNEARQQWYNQGWQQRLAMAQFGRALLNPTLAGLSSATTGLLGAGQGYTQLAQMRNNWNLAQQQMAIQQQQWREYMQLERARLRAQQTSGLFGSLGAVTGAILGYTFGGGPPGALVGAQVGQQIGSGLPQ